jgi:methylamine dehydrogenase accessory protein MauD
MHGIWLLTYLALWGLVALLILAVVALARQIGLIHRRVGPAGARMERDGPSIGDSVPELQAAGLYGEDVVLGASMGKETLLAFISPGCPSCEGLASALRSLWRSDRKALQVIVVSVSGDEKASRAFAERHDLMGIPFAVSRDVASRYKVGAPPYALLIDKHRNLVAKGVVNHMEHLESLLNAAKVGSPSLEALLTGNYESYSKGVAITRTP